MGPKVSETHEEASVHGTASSRHGLWEPPQWSFPGGSVVSGVPSKCAGDGQLLSVCGQPHQEERDACLLTEAPTSSRVTFASCECPWGKRSAIVLPQASLWSIVVFCE